MKNFFKLGCLGVIGLVVLLIIIGALIGGGDDSADKKNVKDQSEETSAADKGSNDNEKKPVSKDNGKEGVLTEDKFNQIKNGMTYEEVKNIVGSEGTVISETGSPGDSLHTAMYEWETDELLSSANFMFQGGKLINKAQMGVTNSSTATITKEKFDEIENGMTYEDVISIIGGEGEILSESGEKGTSLHTVIYSYTGEGGLGANANFTFQGDKLQNKSQFGLE